MKIDFVRFSNSAITPAKGTEDSAGFDLYSVECVTIPSNSIKFIKTDIGFKIPCWYIGKIYARSSLAVYRYWTGQEICQIMFQKIANHPVLRKVKNFDEDKTDRGEGSFGSTNKNVCLNMFLKTYPSMSVMV